MSCLILSFPEKNNTDSTSKRFFQKHFQILFFIRAECYFIDIFPDIFNQLNYILKTQTLRESFIKITNQKSFIKRERRQHAFEKDLACK